jgi:hypothetical protein|tara:strand:- start:991 stop:1488 length:498 start_codon:yes stop_codon:yes gene_type:complete
MKKITLSEQSLYYGDVDMPKGWDIDREEIAKNIILAEGKDLPFLKASDILNTYLQEHINLEYDLNIINKKIFGDIYDINERSKPLLEIDPVDLKNSPDFTLLYGVEVENCMVKIFYDDNRRKGRSWEIPLTNNKFIMFPSTNLYFITNSQKQNKNIVQTMTYEFF